MESNLTYGRLSMTSVARRIIAAALCVGSSSYAYAQSNDHTVAVQDENEIIVTATKRSESLQAVPISVSVVGGDTLSKARITNVDSLTTRVANLQINSTVGDNVPIFSLRGVSMFDYSLNQSSPVATYYDEVYKGNFALLGVAMYDLDRVEVLRGPQGTLYGKNTTGGAVNLISREAKLGETSGYLNVGYGNYSRSDVNSAINVPLADTAALRVAGTFSRAKGWFENVVPGEDNLASVRQYALRATVNAEPSEKIRFKFTGSTSFQNPTNYGVFAQPEAQNRPGLSTRQIASAVSDRRRARTFAVAMRADVDVSDALTLTSISSWDKGTLSFIEDTDGQAAALFEIPYEARARQLAQDLRLAGSWDKLDLIVGLYYHQEKVFNATSLNFSNDLDFNGDGTVNSQDCADSGFEACQFRNRFDQSKSSYAAYVDAKFELNQNLALRGGLRFTHDKGSQSGFTSDIFGVDDVFIANLIPLSNLSYSTDNISGKVGVDYKFEGGNLTYLSVSRGYRAPSFNAQAFFQPAELSVSKPETVTSYEAGFKSQFWDRKITLNLAGFYYDYRNMQVINSDPGTAAQTLQNIDKSNIYGAEAELRVRLSNRFALNAGLGLVSAKVGRGVVSGVDLSGNKLLTAPSLTFNTAFDITIAQGRFGALTIHPEMAYQSSQYFEIFNVARLQQNGYAVFGGHLDWESANGSFNASAWARNLGNKSYFTTRGDLLSGFGFDYNHLGDPRTYGVTFGVTF
jgi:iron complex outermembrane recepter protein